MCRWNAVRCWARLMSAVKDIKAGKPIPKRILTKEGIFPMEVAKAEFPNRKY